MKMLPLHENLDTSFVNLAALIRHLQSRNFAGQISVKLRGYNAKITFSHADPPIVEEHDQIAGRIAEGDEALQRLLIRARESGGAISVFEFAEEKKPVTPEIAEAANTPIAKPLFAPLPATVSATVTNGKTATVSAPTANGNGKPATASNGNGKPTVKNFSAKLPPNPPKNFPESKPEKQAPLPLEFTNRVENRARQMKTSPEEWQTLLRLVGELLGAVDGVLKNSNLNFTAFLDEARHEISDDYPFLSSSSGAFYYANGAVEMSEQVNAKLFAASVNEILRRVFERLADNPQFAEVYRDATQKVLALAHHNKSLYDKFSITPRLNKIIGA